MSLHADIHVIDGPLMVSPQEAVMAATGESVSGFKGAHRKLHLHVLGVVKIGDLWKAIIQVAVEPELDEPEEEHKKEKELHFEREEKRLEEEAEEEAKPVTAGPEEHYVPPDYHHDLYVHFYMHPAEAGHTDWNVVLPQAYPDYTFHFIEDGSMWEASKQIYPDIDLDLAERAPPAPAPHYAQGEDDSAVQPKLKPKKNPYILELTDEA